MSNPIPDTPRSTDRRIPILIVTNLVVGIIAVIAVVGWLSRSNPHNKPAVLGRDADDAIGTMVVRDMGPGDTGRRWYDISYTATLTNASDADFIVPWSLDEIFVGKIAPATSEGASIVNAPPSPDGDTPEGSIVWKRIGAQASYIWTEEALDLGDSSIDENDVMTYLKEAHISTENARTGLIGLYGPARRNVHIAHFRFQAEPDRYASVMISYGTTTRTPMFGDPPDYLYDTRRSKFETVRLGDASAAKCRFGITVEHARVSDSCGVTASVSRHL